MKVLIVSTFDLKGGAAKAAYRLHKSLNKNNVDSTMLVQFKESINPKVITNKKWFASYLAKFKAILNYSPLWFYKDNIHFSASFTPSFDIINKINSIKPDIVHLHWIGAGMLKIEDLLKIKAPIVWSLHDNWAFTGGCHVMWDCEKYKNNCGKCPNLNSQNEYDLSRRQWRRKQSTYENLNQLTIVGMSNWISKKAKESTLLKNKRIITLPNLLETEFFKPLDIKVGRFRWNLPHDKKIILFGANWADQDINKGYNTLFESINKLTGDFEIAIFGMEESNNLQRFNYKTHYLGYIKDEQDLRLLYSAADVTLVPSLQENLSNVIMESMSCGTPVVAYNIGGNSDLIEHKINGYMAEPYKISDFVRGIEWVLHNEALHELKKKSRDKIQMEFDEQLISFKYQKMYESLI